MCGCAIWCIFSSAENELYLPENGFTMEKRSFCRSGPSLLTHKNRSSPSSSSLSCILRVVSGRPSEQIIPSGSQLKHWFLTIQGTTEEIQCFWPPCPTSAPVGPLRGGGYTQRRAFRLHFSDCLILRKKNTTFKSQLGWFGVLSR